MKNTGLFSIKNVVIAILAATLVVTLGINSCQRRQNRTYQHNIETLQDTIQVQKLQNDELLYSKNSLILEKNELQQYLNISKKERKELEKKLNSSLSSVTNVSSNISVDTLRMMDTVFVDTTGVIKAPFKYEDQWLSISGRTVIDNDTAYTSVNDLKIEVPLIVGYTKDNKFFAKSSNPYVSITDIKSASIKRKETKHWCIGFQAGIGAQYGIINKTVDVGPYFGVGVSYGFTF